MGLVEFGGYITCGVESQRALLRTQRNTVGTVDLSAYLRQRHARSGAGAKRSDDHA